MHMAEGLRASFLKVFNVTNASIIKHIVIVFSSGNAYKFKVSAYNFNGEGTESCILTTYARQDAIGIDSSSYLIDTKDSMTVSWEEPTSNRSCPILSYALFMNYQTTGTLAEVNSNNNDNIREKSTLREVTFTTIISSNLGTDYSLRLQVHTIMGWFNSKIFEIRFATVPGKPSTILKEVTASNIIFILLQTLKSSISSYHLQYGQRIVGPIINFSQAYSNYMATSFTVTSVRMSLV